MLPECYFKYISFIYVSVQDCMTDAVARDPQILVNMIHVFICIFFNAFLDLWYSLLSFLFKSWCTGLLPLLPHSLIAGVCVPLQSSGGRFAVSLFCLPQSSYGCFVELTRPYCEENWLTSTIQWDCFVYIASCLYFIAVWSIYCNKTNFCTGYASGKLFLFGEVRGGHKLCCRY